MADVELDADNRVEFDQLLAGSAGAEKGNGPVDAGKKQRRADVLSFTEHSRQRLLLSSVRERGYVALRGGRKGHT